jgi:GNAT superfamily N-acetyltransferase
MTSADGGLRIIEIEPGTPRYAQAKELRYQALYAAWSLPRELVEDTDGRTYRHVAALSGDDLVGYGRIHMEASPPHVYQVCVSAVLRRHGVGTALMEALLGMARDGGACEVTLDARVLAIGFYERLGFTAFGPEFLSGRTHTPHRKMRLVFASEDGAPGVGDACASG